MAAVWFFVTFWRRLIVLPLFCPIDIQRDASITIIVIISTIVIVIIKRSWCTWRRGYGKCPKLLHVLMSIWDGHYNTLTPNFFSLTMSQWCKYPSSCIEWITHLSRKQSSLSVVENQSGCKRKSIRDCKRKPKETLPLQLLSRAPPSPSFAFSLFSGSSSQLSSSCSDPNVGANWCMSVAAKGLNLLVLGLIS